MSVFGIRCCSWNIEWSASLILQSVNCLLFVKKKGQQEGMQQRISSPPEEGRGGQQMAFVGGQQKGINPSENQG